MAIRQMFANLFSTHPPLSDRIARLQAMTIVPSR
jgi:Zn-dependent protease with chaperone function